MRLDIGWRDLAFAAAQCLLPGQRDARQARLESLWSPDALACHSVRSGYDLLLSAADWPAGSEILYSALNVKGMVKIAERHGLQPVPVDLDLETMAPRLDDLERAITDKTRALVVAHLFGARLDLDPLIALARRRGLVVVEDCAQAFCGGDFRGHPEAHLSLFSFGPLKTATALGGALISVREPALRARMREIQAEQPVQTNRSLFVRVLKFSALKLLTWSWVFGTVARAFRLFGRDYEDTVADSVRGAAKLGSNDKLRNRPCSAGLALLHRRLRRFDTQHLSARRGRGEVMRGRLAGIVPMPGSANARHDYWVFPILVDAPAQVIAQLRAEGFDASGLPRSRTVSAPADRPKLEPETAKRALERLVVLPCYPAMPESELEREATVLERALADSRG